MQYSNFFQWTFKVTVV